MTWPGSHSQGVGELGLILGSLKLRIGLVTRNLGVGKGAGLVTRVGCGVDAVLEKGPAPWELSAPGVLGPSCPHTPLLSTGLRPSGEWILEVPTLSCLAEAL